jgi:hypothetical protein
MGIEVPDLAKNILGEAASEVVESFFLETNPIYCDIRCLFDFRITALLCMCSPEEYEIIKRYKEAYNNRVTLDTVSYFKGISIQEHQIDEFLKDIPDRDLFDFRMQKCSYLKMFLAILKGYNTKNFLSGHKTPIRLVMGQNGLVLSEKMQHHIQRIFSANITGINLTFTSTGILDYAEQAIGEFKHFTVYNIEEFLNHPKVGRLLSNATILGVKLHAPPLITKSYTEGSWKTLLENTAISLELFSEFEYIHLQV